MKNRKDSNINVSLGTFSTYYNRSYLTHRSKLNLQNSNKLNKSPSRSKCKNYQQKQVSAEMTPNSSGERTGMREQVHNQHNGDLSRQNSQKKLRIYDEQCVKKRDDKSYRKLVEKQNKIQRHEQKSTHISILQERPHQSQNFNHVDTKIAAATHRKLYTFCNQNRHCQPANLTTLKENLNNNGRHRNRDKVSGEEQTDYATAEFSRTNSTIMVKEEELKRFTHKFAREKIEYEQLISNYRQEIQNLSSSNRELQKEKGYLLLSLEGQEEIVNTLKGQMQEMQEKLQQVEKQLGRRNEEITRLQNQVNVKQGKISSLYAFCEQRQKQIQRLEAQESRLSKLFLPLSNINHACSINSSLSSQSGSTPSPGTFQEIEWLRKEKARIENELRNSLTFLEIENQHMRRELQIQKQIRLEMGEEIKQLQSKAVHNNKAKQSQMLESCVQVKMELDEKIKQLQAEIEKLLNQNAILLHHKLTLQRSLQVSSQMILWLKEENAQLKNRPAGIGAHDPSRAVTLEQVRGIILLMMKQQLEMEERCKKMDEILRPTPSLLHSSLQKKYEEGYRSITRKAKKEHCKTENAHSHQMEESRQKRNNTQSSLVQQFSHGQSDPHPHSHMCRAQSQIWE